MTNRNSRPFGSKRVFNMAYKPAKVPSVSVPTIYTANLENFRGVDFTNNALNCESYRSPDMLNMIAGNDGFPVARNGYVKHRTFSGRINGMYLFNDQYLVHHGTKLSLMDGTLVSEGLNDAFSTAVYLDGKLYLLDGTHYLCLRPSPQTGGITTSAPAVLVNDVVGTIPETTIARLPAGGGQPFQAVNMLTPKRTNTFIPDGTAKEYLLDAGGIDPDPVIVYFDNADGGQDLKTEGTDFTVDRTAGKVTFHAAPPVLVNQRATVHITFSKTTPGYADRVKKCTIKAMFGANGGANTIFLTGHPDYPNMVIYSEAADPTYWPDTNYIYVGQDSSRVMGFTLTGDGSLSIHKERNGVDPTIFYLTGEVTTVEGLLTPLYRLTQGATGVGVIAERAFASLGNDALFLASTGVYADKPSGTVTNERYAQSRSFYINSRLTREENLQNAVAIEYKGYYYLAVNGHVYVADGVHDKAYIQNNQINQYEYEWYYWDNVPVRVWFEGSEGLYFGDAQGNIYCFDDGYLDDGEPIAVYWMSKLFDFGTITNLKTVKSVHVMPNPYTHSTINIDFIQRGISETVKETTVDVFDFSDLRFDRLSFETDPTPRIIPVRRRLKKLQTFQMRIWADAGEPLGLFKVAIRYQVGGNIK